MHTAVSCVLRSGQVTAARAKVAGMMSLYNGRIGTSPHAYTDLKERLLSDGWEPRGSGAVVAGLHGAYGDHYIEFNGDFCLKDANDAAVEARTLSDSELQDAQMALKDAGREIDALETGWLEKELGEV